ncbi:MAG TPA: peptide chain release factor N(5)-glutamine methyltransferase [Lentimicrobium sp.]|nr:peptide chain release factor N(5)-glutamine methyltransferase [Lentimicrobium sp.]
MTYGQLANFAIEELKQLYEEREARAIQRYLFSSLSKVSMSDLFLLYNEIVPKDFENRVINSINELRYHKPVQYVTGKVHFSDMDFEVNTHVLIPRPETEELVNLIVKRSNPQTSYNILDIGTGSGIIAVSLAKLLPKSLVSAIDISGEALAIAKKNASSNNTNIDFQQLDILMYLHEPAPSSQSHYFDRSGNEARFDIIVSNPPYVKESEKTVMSPNVLEYEPHLALFVSDDDPLEYYKAIINFAKRHLGSYGMLYFEINESEDKNLKALLEVNGFSGVEVFKDFNGKPRFVSSIKNY